MQSRIALALGLLAAAVSTGCGTNGQPALPPAAEPAESPPLATQPAGRVTWIGNEPEGIVSDPGSGQVVIALRNPAELALVDGRTEEVTRRIALPGAARHLALAAGTVLVPAESENRLLAVDARTGQTVDNVAVGPNPHDAVAVAQSWFVGDEFGDRVSVVRAGRELASVPVAKQPGGLATFGNRLAVVSVRARRLELFDAATLRRLGSVSAGTGPTHVVCGDRGLCLVLDTQGDAILVYSSAGPLASVWRIPLAGGPYGLALDAARDRVWVTLPGANQVVELSIGVRPVVGRRFPTVRQPNSVAVDESSGRVFVAGRADGALETIDP